MTESLLPNYWETKKKDTGWIFTFYLVVGSTQTHGEATETMILDENRPVEAINILLTSIAIMQIFLEDYILFK